MKKNISTLETEKRKEQNTVSVREWLQQNGRRVLAARRAKGRKKLTVSDEYNGVKA